jgi:hypothetical protein
MPPDARQIFLDVVLANPSDHFQPSDMPLLCRYCEAHAVAERAAAELAKAGPIVNGDAAKVFVSMSKLANSLALRLRLSPQARQPRMPKRPPQPVSVYERMRLEREL